MPVPSQGKDTFLSSQDSMRTENAARAHSRPTACLLQKYQNILINQLLNPTCPLKLAVCSTCSKLARQTVTQFSLLKDAIPCVWIFSEKKRNKRKYHTSQLGEKKRYNYISAFCYTEIHFTMALWISSQSSTAGERWGWPERSAELASKASHASSIQTGHPEKLMHAMVIS